MKKYCVYTFLVIASLAMLSCENDKNEWNGTPKAVESIAAQVMSDLWATSPMNADMTARKLALSQIQTYADQCSADYFKSYLSGSDAVMSTMERYEDIFIAYNAAFEKVLSEVKSTVVPNGTVAIWLLYNMGYVVKTPSGCFGVDICNIHAEELAPYIDFLCVTHNHSDHYSTPLMNAMYDLEKPVLSNFFEPKKKYEYLSTQTGKEYTIGKFAIHTCITDHNNAALKNFVTTFQIDCGSDTGNFVFMHVGDSNYNAEQYTITKDIDLFIPRYAVNALTENNVIGVITEPKYVLLSHILELSHAGVDESRWSIELGLARASKINCLKTYMPFWGEKMMWDGTELK